MVAVPIVYNACTPISFMEIWVNVTICMLKIPPIGMATFLFKKELILQLYSKYPLKLTQKSLCL